MFKYNFFLDILFFLIFVHDNIILTQIFHDMSFDLKDHGRSHEVTFMIKRNFILNIFFCLKSGLIKYLRMMTFWNFETLTNVLVDNFVLVSFISKLKINLHLIGIKQNKQIFGPFVHNLHQFYHLFEHLFWNHFVDDDISLGILYISKVLSYLWIVKKWWITRN